MRTDSNIILELTDKCNLNCDHCLKSSGMKSSGNWSLPYEKVLCSLEEIRDCFGPKYDIKLSGGEPTIWRDGEKDIIDVLQACVDKGLSHSLVTNGTRLKHAKFSERFIKDYINYKNTEKNIFITVDHWHENLKANEERIDLLDSVYDVYKEFIDSKKLVITIQSTISKVPGTNINTKVIGKYSKKGFDFILNPFLPWGRGVNLDNFTPKLPLSGNDKSCLGSYREILLAYGIMRGNWKDKGEFDSMPNIDVLFKSSTCGKSIEITNEEYLFCIGRREDSRFILGRIGEMKGFSIDDWIAKNEIVQKYSCTNIKDTKESILKKSE